jgi:hypothetical protein
MSQSFFYTQSVDVYRLVDDTESPNDTESYGVHLKSISCCIQPWDMTYRQDFGGVYVKDFVMYCDVVDIQEHDKIINGLDEYIVSGKKIMDFFGNSHLELQLTKS